jgi:hypothetical protein
MWFIREMVYISAIQKNEALVHVMTWLNLENMVSEKSYPKKPYIPFLSNMQNTARHGGTH